MKFEDLRLSKPLLDAVHTAGYETPTPIQARVIPLILEGRDVLGCAQTGTGKTAAFALPILQRLSNSTPSTDARPSRGPSKGSNARRSRTQNAQPRNIRALVLAPTRELAQQIADSFATYGKSSGLKHTVVFGGVNKNAQLRALRGGVDILVATPGRLLDHMSEGDIRLDSVETLVLDEADRMLDMGFLPDIRRILNQIPKRRQTLLLSATMPPPIRHLAKDILANPVSVEVARVSAPAENVEHRAYYVEKQQKQALLCSVLENTAYSRALVFTRTKHGADKVVRHLSRSGIAATAIHGNKSQNARTRALENFRSGKIGVLVATDIAARGLDVDGISHVINYDLTTEPETYVHRIGRTARAGASGMALSFVSLEDHDSVRDIERLIHTELKPAESLPGYVAPEMPVVKPKRAAGTGSRKISNADKSRTRHRFTPKQGGRRRPRRSRSGPSMREGSARSVAT
ncbi:MAG: DEAD/DEAH box helicase [Planctomycetes bacterium]|nr:DEAD/DEAH box helicase [Planctomycetota bacterium]